MRILRTILAMFLRYFEGIADPLANALPSAGETTVASNGILPTQYDDLLFRYGKSRDLPVAYLRALAKRESNMNPNESTGSYWGLMQVGWRGKNSVLAGYNARHGTSFVKDDLLDPETNVKIAVDLIGRIAKAYRAASQVNPALDNMRPNFDNPEFVKLLTAGWNSGYSKASGVQYVAKYLAKRNLPVTHANVFEHAREAGATRYLQATGPDDIGRVARRKRDWQKSVSDLYFRTRGGGSTPRKPDGKGGAGPLVAALILPLGLLLLGRK